MMKKIVEGAQAELKEIIDEICVNANEVEKMRIYNIVKSSYVNLVANVCFHISNKAIHVDPVFKKGRIKMNELTFKDLFRCVRCAEETKNDDDASCEISDGSEIAIKTNCLRCGLPVRRIIEADHDEITITDE